MSFFTSLTGLNAATTQLGVTSNNIANAGTTGFKRSRAEFGDIFSSSPLQKASSIVGQGTLLKGIQQEFSQGNIEFSENTLDLAISGQGFFALKPDLTSPQTVFTRNGSFSLNNDRYVVDNSGQFLRAFPVNEDGSVVATTLDAAIDLRIPEISGLPRASTEIELGVNLPADAEVIPAREEFRTGRAVYSFDPDDPETFNTSTSITVFDSLGNPSIATIFYIKTQNASTENPSNKWQTRIFVGDREIEPSLITAKNDREETLFINRFGELTSDPQSLDPSFIPGSPHPKYVLDNQPERRPSQPARVQTPIIPSAFTFGSTGDIVRGVGTVDGEGNLQRDALPSQNLFQISVDGSSFRTISLSEPGEFNGTELAAALTREVNRAFGDERTFRLDEGSTNTFRIAAFSRDQDENEFEILTGAVSPRGLEASDDRTIDLERLEVVAGEQYSIQIGNRRFTETATANDTKTTIAEKLAVRINSVTGFVAAVVDADGEPIVDTDENPDFANLPADFKPEIRILDGAGNLNVLVDSSRNQPDLEIALPTTRTEVKIPSINTLRLGAGEGVIINGQTIEPGTVTVDGVTVDRAFTPNSLVDAINAESGDTGVRAVLEGDSLILRATQADFNQTISIENLVDPDDNTQTLDTNVLGLAERVFGPEEVLYTPSVLVSNAQEQIDAAGLAVDVSYDINTRSLTFKPRPGPEGLAIEQLLVRGGTEDAPAANELLGLRADGQPQDVGPDLRDPEFRGSELVPNGPSIIPSSQQRFGIEVNYLRESQRFEFSSGSTGVDSRIVIEPVLGADGDPLNEFAAEVLGLNSLSTLEGEGLSSQPAVTVSGQPGRDISGAFFVTEQDNRVSVSIDGISGVIRIPPASYTGETFARALESRINLIEDANGRRVSGVQVEFDVATERFVFTSGTTGADSFVSVNGHPNWGLSETDARRGDVPQFLDLVQDTDELGRLIFVDRDGNETVESVGAANQEWFPVYLRKGELTFDTQGRLLSPKEGAQYDPFDPLNGADPIVLNVDYGRNSTQFNAPFSLLSLSQDGFPSGRLDGLEVDASGIVRATYTNGQQLALGKIILANFPNPNGLKQIGDANFLTTATSGAATLGQAGSEGFGSIESGARERANVDLTNELVDLITAQRNFQSNAKAIETSNSLTQTIINIRG